MLKSRSLFMFVVLLIGAIHCENDIKSEEGDDSDTVGVIINGSTELPIDVTTLNENTTAKPTVTPPTPPPSTSSPTTTTTKAPSPTNATTTSTTSEPTTTASTTPVPTTTVAPSTTVVPTTTAKPIISTTETPPAPHKDRHFDGASFIGGIILAVGLMGIGFIAFKFYKARTERNYHTL